MWGVVPRGDVQGRARWGRWAPGARQEPREEEQLSEESRAASDVTAVHGG